MKKLIYFSFAALIAFASCNPEETAEETCNNQKLDNGETEIDCGGECEPCPFPATLTCMFDGYTYVASSVDGNQQGNGISITSDGTAGTNLSFSFSGVTENTSLPIIGAGVYTLEATHNFELSDTGHVVITSHDQLRKIISGRFSFSLHKSSSEQKYVQEGTFENVRYGGY